MGRGGGSSSGRGGGHSGGGGSHGFSSSRSSSRSSGSISRGASSHSYSSSSRSYGSSSRDDDYYGHRSSHGGNIYIGNVGGGYSVSGGSGGVWTAWLLFAFFVLLFLAVVSSQSSDGYTYSATPLPEVTHTHTPMVRDGVVQSSEWVVDNVDWIAPNEMGSLEAAMGYFQQKTGVQPLLVIDDDVNGSADFTDAEAEEWLGKLYWQKFSDDGHIIVAFIEYEDSVYVDYIYAGRLANGTIDAEARDIMMAMFDRYYTATNLSDAQYFSKVFRESADAIMVDYEASQGKQVSLFACICVVVGAVVVCIVAVKITRSREKAYEAAQKLASTPVDEMSGSRSVTDAVGESLESKYGDGSNGSVGGGGA